jgi:hypothetical protein
MQVRKILRNECKGSSPFGLYKKAKIDAINSFVLQNRKL